MKPLLLMNYYLRSNIFKSLSYAMLALKLFKNGRLSLFEKGLKDRKNLQKLLQKDIKQN